MTPISPDGKKLLIYFDGNGHIIKNVKMNGTKDGTGLFGDIWGSANPADVAENTSVIKNLVISSSTFASTNGYVGALVGEVSGTIIIENIYVDKDVVVGSASKGSNGGIVGGCYYSSKYWDSNGVAECTITIKDCVFAGTVIAGGTDNGGILGNGNSKQDSEKHEIFHIVIEDCLVTGNVQIGQSRTSGFVGRNEYTVTFGEGEEAVTYAASVTLNRCIYAGGAEDVAFNNRPFVSDKNEETQYNVTNCYTTHTAANGVYSNVKWTAENSGVTLIDAVDLLGKNAIELTGWTKCDGDIMLPTGVKDLVSNLFTAKMLDGASVRLDTPTGLRFQAIIGASFLNSIKNDPTNAEKLVTYGIIIAPTDYIEEADGTFTVAALSELAYDISYVLIPAQKLVSGGDDAGYYEFTGVLGPVNPDNYSRAFSARAYIAVDGEIVYYSAYDSAINSRSIAEVAEAAYKDTKTEQDDEYKYEIAVDAGIYSPYTTTQRETLYSFYGEGTPATVNFMSYNIRNVEGGNKTASNDPLTFEYEGRQNAVVDYILSKNPDVIGIQEASKKKIIIF